jgi:CubicO group peptidase (beta-lactamase class C family)
MGSWRIAVGPLVALAFALGTAEAHADGDVMAKIDAAVRRLGIRPDGPGLALLVVEKGNVILKKGYGLANLETRAAVTSETTFELASTSKPFTALAVLRLYERGKLSLADPARKFVPELPPDRDPERPIRIADLLHHTSGLPDYTGLDEPDPPAKGYVDNAAYAQVLAQRQADFTPEFAPGDRHDYSNTNYMLLALIVERISGKSFGTFLRGEVFEPLGMDRAWVYESPDAARARRVSSPQAVGYTRNDDGKYEPTWGAPPDRSETMLVCGDGSIWCSLDDMVQWDRAVRSGRLLSPQTWRQALTASQTRDGETNAYGFGWELEINDDKVTGFFHDGSWEGFENTYYHSLDDDRTIVVLGNHDDVDVDRIWKAMSKILDDD